MRLQTRVRAGFTLVEVLFVLVIAAILMTMGGQSFRKFETSQQLENGRNSLMLLGRRARAEAVNRGTNVRLDIIADSAIARVSVGGTTVIDQVFLRREFGVNLTNGSGANITVCYNARGFAVTSCSSSGLPTTVTVARSGSSSQVRIQVLGTIIKI
jgi:prepilin-type N-terminal cleavage/methylation domain-containing protein